MVPQELSPLQIRPHQGEQRQSSTPHLSRKVPVMRNLGIPAIVGVLLVSLWALILIVSSTQRQRLLDDSQKELAQLNSAVAQHAASLFRDVESNLIVMDLWLQANRHIDPRTDASFVALVAELRRISKGLIDPRMVSTEGKLFYIPTPDGKPLADVSDRSYYKAQLTEGERRLHIGEPVESRVTEKWGIPISWRLKSPVSGLMMVFANIEIAKLDTLHEQMRLKPNGSIVLIRTDGIVLSRTPYEQALIGRDVKSAQGFKEEYGVKQRGSFISDGKITDGVPRIISYQRLEDYPITVLVNRGLEDVLATYERRRTIVYLAAGVLTLLALTLTRAMHLSQNALQQAKEDLGLLEATDSMTGVMSRRAFLELAQRESSRALRYRRPTAVLLLDIDHFKRVNDLHGHAVGDAVLRDCAKAWKVELREQDLLGRVGGEEFCAVLPEAPLESAKQAAERLRKAVANLKFNGKSEQFSVTVSIGLTMVLEKDADFAQSMERADRALYLAKERGRDRLETVVEKEHEESAI